MKNYKKPVIYIKKMVLKEKTASLNSWLQQNDFDVQTTGITTYIFQS